MNKTGGILNIRSIQTKWTSNQRNYHRSIKSISPTRKRPTFSSRTTNKSAALKRTKRTENWRNIQKELRKIEVETEIEKNITEDDVRTNIKLSSDRKSPGIDDIPYEFLKHLEDKGIQMLTSIMNKSSNQRELPAIWKKARIIPILKAGKRPEEVLSYRPISLTSCVSNILEKIIATRLLHWLEKNNNLNPHQAGLERNGKRPIKF